MHSPFLKRCVLKTMVDLSFFFSLGRVAPAWINIHCTKTGFVRPVNFHILFAGLFAGKSGCGSKEVLWRSCLNFSCVLPMVEEPVPT